MKILVYGVGALGSLMIHYLIKAGNDVTVVARSTYGELRRNGIVITKLGNLMVSDHCKNGVKEMKSLDQYFHQFRNQKKGSAMPTWNKMRKEAKF